MSEDLFSQLRPLLGKQADALKIAYTLSDAQAKQGIEAILAALSSTIGLGITPPDNNTANGNYHLGRVLIGGRAAYPLGLNRKDLFHIGVFGQTGRGKTNAVLVLLQQLSLKGVPFWVFDWKRTGYRDLQAQEKSKVTVYTVGRPIAPFHFNPLIPPPGVEYTTWVKQFVQCLSHAYFLGHGCEMILLDVIHPHRTPTLRHLLAALQRYPANSRKLYWLQSTERAVKALCYGGIDQVFNAKDHHSIETLLEHNLIFELDALSDSEAQFFVEILLSAIYLYRKEQRHSGLQHVCVIEEAHHILSKEDQAKEAKSVMDKLLREIREYGEAFIVVDQMPSSLLTSAMANLTSQITFSLSLNLDVHQMGDAMLLNHSERHWLGRLPLGVAMVKLQNRWHSPFLVNIPHCPIKRGIVTDTAIAKQRTGFFAQKSLKSPLTPKAEVISPPSPKDYKNNEISQELLKDILKHPHSTMTKRYQRLRLNPRVGVQIKDLLRQQRLIQESTIKTAKARVKLLNLTELGHAATVGPGSRTSGWQTTSLEHQYWLNNIKHHLTQKGYTVFEEHRLQSGGAVDLLAVKGNVALAVEVETGKSDIRSNIDKCKQANLNRIIFAATNRDAKNRIDGELIREGLSEAPKFFVVEAQRFSNLKDL